MDTMRSGHPRTLQMHQEMQVRNIQRHAAQETAQSVSRDGFNVAMVTDVNPMGGVQLEGFTKEDGSGTWFNVLNHVTPQPGEFAIYAYIKGVPFVLGVPPTPSTTPWRGPRSGLPDTFFFDDFDVGNTSGGGWIGSGRWTWGVGLSSAVALASGANDHPGHLSLVAGNSLNTYAYSTTLAPLILPESISEAEWMVKINAAAQPVASGHWSVGFTDSPSALTNCILAICDYSTTGWGANWCLAQAGSGAKTNVGDTGVPVVAAHWYKINLKHRVGAGRWRLTVTDVTDANDPIEGEAEANEFQSTIATYPFQQAFNRGTNGEKWMYVDYVWWARLGLRRGGR